MGPLPHSEWRRVQIQGWGSSAGPIQAGGGTFLRRLNGSGAPISQVGGKAASLDRLAAFGFPVPEAVALTDEAYRAFAAGPELTLLLRELRTGDVPPPDRMEAEIAPVDQAFLDAPMQADIAEAIRRGAAPLLSRGAVAVRSSPQRRIWPRRRSPASTGATST